LREFVRRLEKEGQLKRVRAEVDPVLEITEIVQRVGRGRDKAVPRQQADDNVGPALLFEKPKGSRVPLLVNAYGVGV
jgi:4-hydroxy-3-polyprenylbenzoate decarboxylase